MQTTVIKKESKNRISVDYEGKMTFKERLQYKLKNATTWLKVLVRICRFVLMLGVSFVILYPFFARIAQSFMTHADIIDATVSLIPKHFTLDTYKYIIIENHYFEALWHTALLSICCALLQTLVACLVGYGLAKFKFKGNKAVMLAVIISMVIPHGTIEIAMSKLFTDFDIFTAQSLGYAGPVHLIRRLFGITAPLDMTQTFAPLMILSVTGLAFKNGLYIYLMRQFFKGVPDELEESAYVDGSGVIRTFFQIIIPLSVPMMITIFLFSFSWQWTDEFYTKMIWGLDSDFYLMPDVYRNPPEYFRTQYENAAGWAGYANAIQNTAGLLIIAPLVILYLFCQKYLVQGIERSGLVG